MKPQQPPKERVFGSTSFISLGRNLELQPPPRKFVPTVKHPEDVVI